MFNKPSLQPVLHNPMAASSIDTSPEMLGLVDSPAIDLRESGSPHSRVKRLSTAVEKTVDKLGRSISGKATSGNTLNKPSTPPSSGHRRIFSINRKGKAREKAGDNADGKEPRVIILTCTLIRHAADILSSSSTPSASRSVSPVKAHNSPAPPDDSPFIIPPSPILAPVRPMLSSFRGDGSVSLHLRQCIFIFIATNHRFVQMRAGTQTLIQVLGALPWTADPDNEDDVMHHGLAAVDSESDGDDGASMCQLPYFKLALK